MITSKNLLPLWMAACFFILTSLPVFADNAEMEDPTSEEMVSTSKIILVNSQSSRVEEPFIIEPILTEPIDPSAELGVPEANPVRKEMTVLSSPPARRHLPLETNLFTKITNGVDTLYERWATQQMTRKITALRLASKQEEKIKILDKLQELLLMLGYSEVKQALASEGLPSLKDLIKLENLEAITQLKNGLQSIESRYLR